MALPTRSAHRQPRRDSAQRRVDLDRAGVESQADRRIPPSVAPTATAGADGTAAAAPSVRTASGEAFTSTSRARTARQGRRADGSAAASDAATATRSRLGATTAGSLILTAGRPTFAGSERRLPARIRRSSICFPTKSGPSRWATTAGLDNALAADRQQNVADAADRLARPGRLSTTPMIIRPARLTGLGLQFVRHQDRPKCQAEPTAFNAAFGQQRHRARLRRSRAGSPIPAPAGPRSRCREARRQRRAPALPPLVR